jgi:DNA-directed RNA polymerase subunit RPC12/RpoP
MSTRYEPGCKDEKSHTCDMCQVGDGRGTIYWQEKDFDLCHDCLVNLYKNWLDERWLSEPLPQIHEPTVIITRAIIPEYLRNKIYERDGYKCLKCGSINKLTIDHITPFSKGGKTEESNLQTLCKNCNSKKGNRD